MNRFLFFIAIFCTTLSAARAQHNIVMQYFDCNGNNTSIPLPDDFKGPKYFNYEEGAIIDFYAVTDTCVVSVLCGGNAELKLDSSYQVLSHTPLSGKRTRITYYSKQLRCYARKDYLDEYLIMYDHANPARKEELDGIFDKLENK